MSETFDAASSDKLEPLEHESSLKAITITSSDEIQRTIDGALTFKNVLLQKNLIIENKYHLLLLITVQAEDTSELISNTVVCQLASSKPTSNDVTSSPQSDYHNLSRTFKFLQANLLKSLLKGELPPATDPLNHLIFAKAHALAKLEVSFVAFLYSEADDFAFNQKTLDFVTAMRRPALDYQEKESAAFVIEGELTNPAAKERPKERVQYEERRSSLTPPKDTSKAGPKDKTVHFLKDSAGVVKDAFNEKYENDDSIYDKIALLKDMREEKKKPKQPLVHNQFNDIAQAVPGSVLDFWTFNIDFHNHGDINLLRKLEDSSKKVSQMARRVVQTDCCKKFEQFVDDGFRPTFFSKDGHPKTAEKKPQAGHQGRRGSEAKKKQAAREVQNDSASLHDMLDMI